MTVAMVHCAEEKTNTAVMVDRVVDYAKNWLSKKSTEARAFLDDEDSDGVVALIIGAIILLLILTILPGILAIVIGPLFMLFRNNAVVAQPGLVGVGTTLGGNIPTINVNEILPGRKRREVIFFQTSFSPVI